MQQIAILFHDRPALLKINSAVLDVFPSHDGYLQSRFSNDDPTFLDRSEEVAACILAICGEDIGDYVRDYQWMCERFLDEELHFVRTGRYRLSTFDEALKEIYSDPGYMRRYVRGILISQLLWSPHARAMDLFRTRFLPSLTPGSRYLEVGPGHGLFLYWASTETRIESLEAWDVSASSLAETQRALESLGMSRPVQLTQRDLMAGSIPAAAFDAAVISEVLEHLEKPRQALTALRRALVPGGRLFINVPINSPAPDHIYLLRSPDEVQNLVEGAGFDIRQIDLLPATGVSLDRALRRGMSVSCVIDAAAN